jgi:hypothetical protein
MPKHSQEGQYRGFVRSMGRRWRSSRELVLEALGAPAGGFQDVIQFLGGRPKYGGRRFYARFSIRPPLQRREGNPHCMPLVQRQRVQPGGNLGRTGVCHRLSD